MAVLYPGSGQAFDRELFRAPTKEYRGAPFWAWNCRLEEQTLRRQIREMKEMGFGGFFMHARVGLATPYLSGEFMDMVRACADEGEKTGMIPWLYDEDRFPSGQAGGLAMTDPRFRARAVHLTLAPMDSTEPETAWRTGGTYFLAAYDAELESGVLRGLRRIGEQDAAEGAKLYAYCVSEPDEGRFNGKCRADLLSEEAVAEFIRVTYDAYRDACGEKYGKSIFSMFTDEPQTAAFRRFDGTEGVCAWTFDFPQTFRAFYGCDVLDTLPELFFPLPDGRLSRTRWRYFDHVAERFSRAFTDQCAARCEKDGLLLTGHLMGEGTLNGIRFIGDHLRPYRKMQLPGVDMLCNDMELETCVQCRSMVRQYGRQGMLSELYGVTNYDFGFRGYEFQGNWQAAMGVTLRVPHLSWVSMEGRAKRDYPATFGYQAPWYREFGSVEDHFARLNTVLTRGKPVCRVAVVHPGESYWLFYPETERHGPYDILPDRPYKCRELTEKLLWNQIDFDYLSESLLPEQNVSVGRTLCVGEMTYEAVLVHRCVTLRRSTADLLERFAAAGGRVIFVGERPAYEELEKTERFSRFGKTASLEELPALLLPQRDIVLHGGETFLCQLRQDGDVRWLFLTNADRNYEDGAAEAKSVTVQVRGAYCPTLYDTHTGETCTLAYRLRDGKTVFSLAVFPAGSALIRLEPTEQTELTLPPVREKLLAEVLPFPEAVGFTLSEDNVLLLDRAEWSLDGGAMQPEEELPRLRDRARRLCGYSDSPNGEVQPWCEKPERPVHTLKLRFRFESAVSVPVRLAVEHPENAELVWNGVPVRLAPDGFYVDRAIRTLKLTSVRRGENVLEMRTPFGRRTWTEWCYLLGAFGVRTEGTKKSLTALPELLRFADITAQGLPFYGHDVTYRLPVRLEKPSRLRLSVPDWKAQLLRVYADGRDCGAIVCAPFEKMLPALPAGEHLLEIRAYGSLVNAFGPLHYCGTDRYLGPAKWNPQGEEHTEEYCLHPFGILSAPTAEAYPEKL